MNFMQRQCGLNVIRSVTRSNLLSSFETLLKKGLVLAALVTVLSGWAQGPSNPGLSVQVYAGLTITGEVGMAYIIQTAVNLTNGNWATLTNLTLPAKPCLWVDASGPASGQRFYRALAVPTNMAYIPAGTFTMGDTSGDSDAAALPLHTVTVSAFYMDTNSVTKAQWDAVYTWAATNGYGFDGAGAGKAANHPVQTVMWYDCVKWCNARSQKEEAINIFV
ncbi:MAG: SUMF1/EgtB/PvdO family nonheme iron enzyme [Verrucomicrobiota bacterium]